jgi:asparagine synthetase B (glutamine-hydrolysing)
VLVRSSARVLLSGLGADEQLAGYARHRSAWALGGVTRLAAELETDTGRLWQRNLGRDDRITADHEREVRLPFLDESVAALIKALPVPCLVDLALPFGVGDKRALRVVAHLLGLRRCACLVKRAIHFGSRIAKQSNQRAFGSNAKGKGDAAFVFSFAVDGGAAGAGAAEDDGS